MAIEGVDYSTARPSPAGLVRAGKKFVIRYGGPGSTPKHIQAGEAAALSRAGLWIVANAEGSSRGFSSRTAGAQWARSADAHFRSIGMPTSRPIYFSADWDVQPHEWPKVADALRGAAAVIGLDRVGIYGSYDVMRWARNADLATWYWQTYAWSGGKWAPGNDLEQYHNGVSVAGGDTDLNRAHPADYGQWMPGKLPSGRDAMADALDVPGGPELGKRTVRQQIGDTVYLLVKGNKGTWIYKEMAEARLRDEAILAAVKPASTVEQILAGVKAESDKLAAQIDNVDETILDRISTAGVTGLNILLRNGLTEAERVELANLLLVAGPDVRETNAP